MITHSRNIFFILVYYDEEIEVATYEGEFRNLMILINEKIYVEDFGECKGIGRCGTCLVEVEGLDSDASKMERNEKKYPEQGFYTKGESSLILPDHDQPGASKFKK